MANIKNTTGTEIDLVKRLEQKFFDLNPTKQKRNTDESMDWFRNFISKNYKSVRLPRLLQDSNLVTNKFNPGDMVLFQYDPKWKDKLNIYDTLPLVIPCGAYTSKQGVPIMVGLNFHYLAPVIRAKALMAIINLKAKKSLSWSILRKMSEVKFFEHALHSYRLDHIKSKFVNIPDESFEIVAFLPTQRWKGGTNKDAWNM